MKAKHTPGPWSVKKTGKAHRDIYAGDQRIAKVLHFYPGVNKSQNGHAPSEAPPNAALMAAAPDLYEMCKRLIDYRERVGPFGFQLEKMDDFLHQLRKTIEDIES